MNTFNDADFLLMNDYGKKLYHEVAAKMPIIDPHNHIDLTAFVANHSFENIAQLLVKNDPYKHRAMRIYGIDESFITGNASDYEKFQAWASCFPSTVGNPLFHWGCMELKALFGIDTILNPQTADQIWQQANRLLQAPGLGAVDIVKKFGVEMFCTSDDLLDSLSVHIDLAQQNNGLTCLPSLRSDSIINFNASFYGWVEKLQDITQIKINTLADYKNAVGQRLDFFDAAGCLLSDHSLDSGFSFIPTSAEDAALLFADFLNQQTVDKNDLVRLQSHLLYYLGMEYAKRQWKMQLHIGAYRYTSSVLRNKVGPAGGYACIGHTMDIASICAFLDALDLENNLPKTILYTLNPADNAVLASLTGSYAEDGVRGKIQFGPAWWYNDHLEGILDQLKALSSYGLLGTSIGMTTDSRSIASFSRHDYFRRIFCNLIGSWVQEAKLPEDWEMLSTLVKNISYHNIKNWLQK